MNLFMCDLVTPARDGALDNGVIAHLFWYGMVFRLTGGPATVSCLSNNEAPYIGWSDLGALIMTMEPGDTGPDPRGIGTYLFGQAPDGAGVRTQRYSTDLGVNNRTYGDLGSVAIPHGVGEVWTSILWEVVWALIDEYGFDPDFYGGASRAALWQGNKLAIQLIVDGMKLQPCSPGFVDARDAILSADQALTGGANQCLLWKAFAKRGLGFSANQGSSGSTVDGTEAYDIHPEACTLNFTNGFES